MLGHTPQWISIIYKKKNWAQSYLDVFKEEIKDKLGGLGDMRLLGLNQKTLLGSERLMHGSSPFLKPG